MSTVQSIWSTAAGWGGKEENMSKKITLLSLGKIADPAARARIAEHCEITEIEEISEEALLRCLPGHEAVLVPFTAQMLVTERVIDAAPQLRLIASTYGGTRQNIADLYALRKGITVIHTGASREQPMAEYTLGLVLASLLRIAHYHHDMVSGEAWPRFKYPRTRILSNRKVAVIGFGRIGGAIIRLFRNFTPELSVVSRHLTNEDAAKAGVKKVSLDEAFRDNEVIILAGGSNADTFHMVGAKQFAAMQEDALFVNIARGKMVDQAAMIEAAQTKQIFLALDVFENEPLESDSPLRTMERVLLTPHRANNSIEFEQRWNCLADEIERFATGKQPESALSAERAAAMSES